MLGNLQVKKRLRDALPQSLLRTYRRTKRKALALYHAPQVSRMEAITQSKPLILKVETINVCNAACVFCGYTSMKRQKGIMTLETFEKVAREYSEMGGGALSFTPVVGDFLLDPHLKERFDILAKYPKINQITFTTNAIALKKYSDEDVKTILSRVFMIQFSIGGLDKEGYEKLYGVDRFDEVFPALSRVLKLRREIGSQAHVHFAFRTNNADFEKQYSAQLDAFRTDGAHISHISVFHNYAGLVNKIDELNLSVNEDSHSQGAQDVTCGHPTTHLAVLFDGKVTGCGCADVQGEGLIIGHAEKESLQQIWTGKKRQAILDSFAKNKPPALCQKCTAYIPKDSLYSGPACAKMRASREKIPEQFYLNYFGA